MKLDGISIKNMRDGNENLKSRRLYQIEKESQKSQYPNAYKKLCELIFERMTSHKSIITMTNLPEYTEVHKLKSTYDNTEHQFYYKLLNDPKTKEGFLEILNMTLEYKRQNEFLNNVTKTGKAVKWGA